MKTGILVVLPEQMLEKIKAVGKIFDNPCPAKDFYTVCIIGCMYYWLDFKVGEWMVDTPEMRFQDGSPM